MYDPRRQHEFDRWTTSQVVCGFTTTTPKKCVAAAKDNNSGRGLGYFHETT